jgi:chromosome segregation ATPase
MMTDEEMRRTMEFILQQQAQFAASIQRLEEERARDQPRLKRLEDSFLILVQLAETVDARLDTLERDSTALESRTAALENGAIALESKMAALAEAQAHADQRLSALIDIVIEGRNGKA